MGWEAFEICSVIVSYAFLALGIYELLCRMVIDTREAAPVSVLAEVARNTPQNVWFSELRGTCVPVPMEAAKTQKFFASGTGAQARMVPACPSMMARLPTLAARATTGDESQAVQAA